MMKKTRAHLCFCLIVGATYEWGGEFDYLCIFCSCWVGVVGAVGAGSVAGPVDKNMMLLCTAGRDDGLCKYLCGCF